MLLLIFLLLLRPAFSLLGGNKADLSEHLIDLCKCKGIKFITFYSSEEGNSDVQLFLERSLRISKLQKPFRSRRISKNEIILNKYDQDNLIVISSDDIENMETNLELISKTKIMMSIMVIINPINQTTFQEIELLVRNLSRNMYFYIIYMDNSGGHPISCKRIISIQNNKKILVQSIKCDSKKKPKNDMEGIHLTCLTLSWPPYVDLLDCNDGCTSVGYLPDLFNLLGERLNFTWHCDAEPNEDWGVVPVSGPANISGVWGGVVGKVATGMYPFSLAQWLNIENRIGMFDFVNIGKGLQFVMALIPKRSKYDSSLYTRPFRHEVWWTIGFGNILIICFLFVSWGFSHMKFGRKRTNTSFRMIKSIAWITYFLLVAYYGGALKMFFTTKITIPFESQKQVIIVDNYFL
jgi:hypothetical protein